MKNLHILPTDKPSRLTIRHKTKELLHSYKEFANYQVGGDKINTNQHIYITSDEEIQEGVNQWYLDKFLNKPYRSGGAQYGEKQNVIILTTDTDLIKDGVQAIEDSFLEWFVKNPSCKEVEVKEMKCTGQCWKFIESDYEDTCLSGCELKGKYKIIIPKEEQCTCKKHDPYCCHIHGSCPTCVKKEEPKQETLEEAIKKLIKLNRQDVTYSNTMTKKPTTPKHLQIMCEQFNLLYNESSLAKLKSGEIKIWEDESQSTEWESAQEFIRMMEQFQEASAYFERFYKMEFGEK